MDSNNCTYDMQYLPQEPFLHFCPLLQGASPQLHFPFLHFSPVEPFLLHGLGLQVDLSGS